MAKNDDSRKTVCVTISIQDHERLTRLAQESGRMKSGYMRWLLHEHFKALDKSGK